MLVKKFNKLRQLGTFQLTNLALDLNIMDGHSAYRKFIILGRARTGSNFLRGLLHVHPQITVFGELFRDNDIIGWDIPSYSPHSKKLLGLAQNEPVKLLKTRVFRKYPKHIRAVGFKLFYYHAHDENQQSLWQYIQNDPEFHIIHIKRRNKLRTHLSEERAWKTNKWVNTSGKKEDRTTVSLDYEGCLQKFVSISEQEREYNAFFSNNPQLEVFYEDLAADYTGESKRIQQFLGVDYQVLNPSTHKQTTQPLSQAISNYFELKKQFEATPWRGLFEE